MALVVLLRGVNVGGHRTFRPSALAADLKHLRAINIGAAGTFVIPEPISRKGLRAEFARRLPFQTEVAICEGRDITRMLTTDVFVNDPARPKIVHFVSFLSRSPRSLPKVPMSFPTKGKWMLKILAVDKQFVFGVYRREMKAIGYLGMLDRVFDVSVTTRNWNTIAAIAQVLSRIDARHD